MRWVFLVVTATAGFRHESIEVAEQVLAELAAPRGIEIVFARTEDDMRARLTPDALRGIDAVLFVNTTGELPAEPREALLRWVSRGGTFAGVHSASDTWHSSPEYIEMLGAEFVAHPPDYVATILVEDANHPATRSLPTPHAMLEEIYAFHKFDRDDVHLLLSLNGTDPLAWEKKHGRGDVLYTALGHRDDVWQSPWFRAHAGGILDWAVARQQAPSKRRAVGH